MTGVALSHLTYDSVSIGYSQKAARTTLDSWGIMGVSQKNWVIMDLNTYPRKSSAESGVPEFCQESLRWLVALGEHRLASRLAGRVASTLPEGSPQHSEFLMRWMYRSRSFREAALAAKALLALGNLTPELKVEIASCLGVAGLAADAESLMREVLATQPDWAGARVNLGLFVAAQGRFEEAEKIFEALIGELPSEEKNWQMARYNLAIHRMRRGDAKEAFACLRAGRIHGIWGSKPPPVSMPELSRGESLRNKTILIAGEGGAGDEMIGARFGKVIEQRGGRAVWLSRQGLASVFSRTPGIGGAVNPEEFGRSVGLKCDYWAPCMDLPYLLDLDLHGIPSEPYLFADSEYARKWQERLRSTEGKLRVGIRWAGNPRYETDLMRTVPLSELSKLFDVPGVQFYSLQKDEAAELLPKDCGVIDLGPELTSWEETMGVVENLDLVITSCTSVAHLAAGMGKPTWVLPPLMCYYIWALPGESSPWYPGVRLFRQEQLGSWREPVERVRAELVGRK